VIFQNFKHS